MTRVASTTFLRALIVFNVFYRRSMEKLINWAKENRELRREREREKKLEFNGWKICSAMKMKKSIEKNGKWKKKIENVFSASNFVASSTMYFEFSNEKKVWKIKRKCLYSFFRFSSRSTNEFHRIYFSFIFSSIFTHRIILNVLFSLDWNERQWASNRSDVWSPILSNVSAKRRPLFIDDLDMSKREKKKNTHKFSIEQTQIHSVDNDERKKKIWNFSYERLLLNYFSRCSQYEFVLVIIFAIATQSYWLVEHWTSNLSSKLIHVWRPHDGRQQRERKKKNCRSFRLWKSDFRFTFQFIRRSVNCWPVDERNEIGNGAVTAMSTSSLRPTTQLRPKKSTHKKTKIWKMSACCDFIAHTFESKASGEETRDEKKRWDRETEKRNKQTLNIMSTYFDMSFTKWRKDEERKKNTHVDDEEKLTSIYYFCRFCRRLHRRRHLWHRLSRHFHVCSTPFSLFCLPFGVNTFIGHASAASIRRRRRKRWTNKICNA